MGNCFLTLGGSQNKKIYFNRVFFLLHYKFYNSYKKSITKLVISVIQDEYKRVKNDNDMELATLQFILLEKWTTKSMTVLNRN